MGFSILGFVLALIGLVALALQRFYSSIPAKELKRLAARGDLLAVRLYRAVAFGASLRLLLWMVVSGGLTGGVLLIASGLPGWAAFISVGVILLMAFVLMQSVRLTVRTAGFAAWLAPGIGAFLHRIEPVLGRAAHLANKRRTIIAHSGLYEKEDLTDLLEQQKDQPDNRISHAELELARRALHFDETQAADIMTPRLQLKSVKAGDTIGPILLGELHESGQQSFPVYDDEGEHILGMLHLADAVKAKEGGKVSTVMSKELVYVHEDFTLRQALDALLSTRQPLALVVNGFEEILGVVSLDGLMHELLGEASPSHEAALPYENRAAIAAYAPAAQASDANQSPETPGQTGAETSRAN